MLLTLICLSMGAQASPKASLQEKEAFKVLLKDLETAKTSREDSNQAPVPQDIKEIYAQLTKQLARCWNPVDADKYTKNQAIVIRVDVNPDRTIQKAQTVDLMRYKTDTDFRVAADNALKALRHPYCTPLDLPPDRYDLWKTITFSFDASLMK